MKYIWMILVIIMLSGIGLAYVISGAINYFSPKRSQTEIIVESPNSSE